MLSSDRAHPDPPVLAADHLSPRERVVVDLLARGLTVDAAAARLFVSRNTVKTQLRSAYRKLGVSTRRELVAVRRDVDSVHGRARV